MHWVTAEAMASAAALFQTTGEAQYAADYEQWLAHAQEFFMDHTFGSWHHELDTSNRPSANVWPGKMDIYHVLGALLVPLLPLTPSLASATSETLS